MCLGIPPRITEVTDDGLLRMGKVDFGSTVREICLAYVSEAQVGDFVIVHAGFAISQIDEDEARQTFSMLKQAGLLAEEWSSELAARIP